MSPAFTATSIRQEASADSNFKMDTLRVDLRDAIGTEYSGAYYYAYPDENAWQVGESRLGTLESFSKGMKFKPDPGQRGKTANGTAPPPEPGMVPDTRDLPPAPPGQTGVHTPLEPAEGQAGGFDHHAAKDASIVAQSVYKAVGPIVAARVGANPELDPVAEGKRIAAEFIKDVETRTRIAGGAL